MAPKAKVDYVFVNRAKAKARAKAQAEASNVESHLPAMTSPEPEVSNKSTEVHPLLVNIDDELLSEVIAGNSQLMAYRSNFKNCKDMNLFEMMTSKAVMVTNSWKYMAAVENPTAENAETTASPASRVLASCASMAVQLMGLEPPTKPATALELKDGETVRVNYLFGISDSLHVKLGTALITGPGDIQGLIRAERYGNRKSVPALPADFAGAFHPGRLSLIRFVRVADVENRDADKPIHKALRAEALTLGLNTALSDKGGATEFHHIGMLASAMRLMDCNPSPVKPVLAVDGPHADMEVEASVNPAFAVDGPQDVADMEVEAPDGMEVDSPDKDYSGFHSLSEGEKRAACLTIVNGCLGFKHHHVDIDGLISSMASMTFTGSVNEIEVDLRLAVFDNTVFEVLPEAGDRMLDAMQRLGNRCPPPDVMKQFTRDYYKELLLRAMPPTTSFKGVRGVKKPAGMQLTRQNINYLQKQIDAHKNGTKILSEAKLAEYEQRLQFGKVPFQNFRVWF